MTTQEAVAFIQSITPVNVDMVQIDKVKWDAFTVLVIAALQSPTVDPKYKAALEAANVKIDEANVIVDEALK